MRIVSQDGMIDVPYDLAALGIGSVPSNKNSIIYVRSKLLDEKPCVFADYSTKDKALKAMEMLRTAYTGRFVTTADIPDDFNEQLKELMKGGFGTVIIKDTNDSRVEFDNLNGYFQLPKDEDVEV